MAPQLRPLSIGELLDQTFRIYRQHFWLFVGMATLAMVLAGGVIALVAIGFTLFFARGVSDQLTISAVLIGVPAFVLGYIGSLALCYAAIVYAASQLYLEQPVTIRGSYNVVMHRFWALTGLVILMGMIIFAATVLGILALIIGALLTCFLSACYVSLSIPAMVLEGSGVMDSLRRSYAMVKGDLGKVALTLFVFWAVQTAASYLLMYGAMVPLLIMSVQHGAQPPVWAALLPYLGQFLAIIVTMPLMGIGLSLVYYDIRIRREAFDLQVMMSSLGPASPPAPASSAASSV
jgi:hypothetical protein